MKTPTRKGNTPIKVYCLPEEKRHIMAKAKAAGLTLSKYLLNVGSGHETKSIVDQERVQELARVNADLGRLGGLLKLWLTDDARVASFDKKTIRTLLHKIEGNQEELRALMQKVVRG